MRTNHPTADEIGDQRDAFLPELRRYEAACRARTPLPNPREFSASDRCRYHGYLQKMAAFEPHSPFRESSVGILHSDLVGLVAAERAFESVRSCFVMLTPDEREVWFENHPEQDLIGGWYWFLFWKIHTVIPNRFQRSVAAIDIGANCATWILTEGRGSSAWHELWSYDGDQARLIDGAFSVIVAEHGPIEEWSE